MLSILLPPYFPLDWASITSSFVSSLKRLWEYNQLNINNVRSLIEKQEYCWITKEQNGRLPNSKQPFPADAYNNASIALKN